jgi:hypothetical protein
MHMSCWQKYVTKQILNLLKCFLLIKFKFRYINSSEFGVNNKIDDFSCPLCETKGNTFLPIYGNFSMYKTLNISNFEIKTKKSESLIEQKLLSKIENEFSDSVKDESLFKNKFRKFIKLFLKNSDSNGILPTNSKF